MEPLNGGHLRVFKNVSVIDSCPLLEGNLKKIVTFGTKCFVRYSWHVRYLGCPSLGSFSVIDTLIIVFTDIPVFPYIDILDINLYWYSTPTLSKENTLAKCQFSIDH